MSAVAVNVFLQDKKTLPLAGVLVKVFDAQGISALTEGVTDGLGVFGCLLPSDVSYQVRCYKKRVAFGNPKYILPLDPAASPPPPPNDFVLLGDPFIPPTSGDPRLCVASGLLRRPDGSPAAGVSVQFIATFDPLLLDGDAILGGERVHGITDRNGFLQVTLIRNGIYDATIEGFEDTLRSITVPDQASVNAPDLLFPVVDLIFFTPPGPYTLAVGQEITVIPTVYTSSSVVLDGTATADVNWRSSDNNILGIYPAQTTVTLRGIGAGSAELRVERNDSSVIRIPAKAITGVPVAVTVT